METNNTMNIQEKIVKIITAIQEAGQGLTREQLQDILIGKNSDNIQELKFDKLESFASAKELVGDDWDVVFDKAIAEGLLKIKKQKNQTLTYTPEGKKFRKKPYSINMNSDCNNDFDDCDSDQDMAIRGGNLGQNTSERSKRQIKLIQAIDRKIALDDFAENENIDLDDVLDDLETLLVHGKRMDIGYFVNEIINADDIAEVKDSLPSGKFDIKNMRKEWGDVYNEQELRLLRYILS